MGTRFPNSSQPCCSTRRVTIISRVIPCSGSLRCSVDIQILFIDGARRRSVQGECPETCLIHKRRNMMWFGQGFKLLLLQKTEDELVRRLLCLKTLLHADQEIFRAFPGDLIARSDDIGWLRFIHAVYLSGIVPHRRVTSAEAIPGVVYLFGETFGRFQEIC